MLLFSNVYLSHYRNNVFFFLLINEMSHYNVGDPETFRNDMGCDCLYCFILLLLHSDHETINLTEISLFEFRPNNNILFSNCIPGFFLGPCLLIVFAVFCVVFVFVLCLVYPLFLVFLDCPFLIAPSSFSNVCFLNIVRIVS